MAKDFHSLWLNSAALARADGDLLVPGGVVEPDERGEPTGVLREESAWHFRERFIYAQIPDEEWIDAMRDGRQARELARRHRGARQGRLDRHRSAGGRAPGGGRADPARLAVAPARPARRESTTLGLRIRLGDDLLRLGYIKVVHGRDARLADGAPAGRLGRRDHEPRGVRRDRAPLARAPASPSPSTRSATRRTATRSTASRRRRTSGARAACGQRIEHAQLLAEEDFPRFGDRRRGVRAVHATRPSDRDLAERRLGRQDRPRVRVALAPRRGHARRERLRRARRGARSARRASAPASCARSTTGRRGIPSRR